LINLDPRSTGSPIIVCAKILKNSGGLRCITESPRNNLVDVRNMLMSSTKPRGLPCGTQSNPSKVEIRILRHRMPKLIGHQKPRLKPSNENNTTEPPDPNARIWSADRSIHHSATSLATRTLLRATFMYQTRQDFSPQLLHHWQVPGIREL
jgi:hypothetical protein